MVIQILSEEAINQIAAGEVIENPASAVKELVENAIDAGASHIVIEALGGGFQSLIVKDDGSGMGPDDALLCIQRHATSKISAADDLVLLRTMGFRGEALAAIAAISKLTLSTALQDAMGIQLHIEAGKVLETRPSARARGTTIEVRSLFYNVPARKKFQKSAAASSAEITRITTFLALAHPHVGFELIQQKRVIFSLPAYKNGDFNALLQKRSAEILGEHFRDGFSTVALQEESCQVKGLMGSPNYSRFNRSGQYLFVNQRPVHCLPLSFAIRDGYATRIESDRHPIFVVHLQIDPVLIDVNVHPQKKEIRLREEGPVKQMLRRAVSLALQEEKTAFLPEICIPEDRLLESPAFMFREQPACAVEKNSRDLQWRWEEEVPVIGIYENYLLVDAKRVRLPHLKEEARGVIWVDLLEVKARILFEQLIQSKKGLGKSQQLLIPLTFSFSQAEAAQLMTCLPDLNELGIVVRAIGPTAFMVEAIPTCLVEKDLQALFHAMISHEESGVKERERAICRGVSTSGKTFSLTEGVALFKQWMAMADWQQSPQGNPIIYFMSKDEITKLF